MVICKSGRSSSVDFFLLSSFRNRYLQSKLRLVNINIRLVILATCVTKHQIPYTVLLFVAFGSTLIHVIVSQPVLQTSIRHSTQLPHVPSRDFPGEAPGTRREPVAPTLSTHGLEAECLFISLSAAASPERVGNKRKLGVISWKKNSPSDCKGTGCPFAHPCPITPLQPPAGSDLKTSTGEIFSQLQLNVGKDLKSLTFSFCSIRSQAPVVSPCGSAGGDPIFTRNWCLHQYVQ